MWWYVKIKVRVFGLKLHLQIRTHWCSRVSIRPGGAVVNIQVPSTCGVRFISWNSPNTLQAATNKTLSENWQLQKCMVQMSVSSMNTPTFVPFLMSTAIHVIYKLIVTVLTVLLKNCTFICFVAHQQFRLDVLVRLQMAREKQYTTQKNSTTCPRQPQLTYWI